MPNPRASLIVLGAAALLVSADARVVDPLLKVFGDEFGVSDQTAGWLVTAYALPYGLCQLLFGTLGDRYGKLNVLAVALACFALGTAACAFVPGFDVLLGLRFATGVAAAAVIPLSLSYIGDTVPLAERQVALGKFMSSLMLGQILSASLGGEFGESLGWRALFLILGGTAAIATAMVARESRRCVQVRSQKTFSIEPYRRLAKAPFAGMVLGSVFVEGTLVFGTLAYLAASMRDRFPDLSLRHIGIMLACYGIGGILYSLSVKRLVPKLGEKGIAMLGGSVLAVSCGLHAWMPAWPWFPVAMVLFGLGYVTLHGTLQTRATELDPAARATAVSLFAFIFFLGQGTGPILFGAIKASGGATIAFAAATVLAVVLTSYVRWWVGRPRPV